MEKARIIEVSPRDGLQNERSVIATKDKIELVDRLSQCGFSKIEVTGFVSPRWVPQMADAAEVMAGITRRPDIAYTALTPNLRGFEAAMAAKADEIAVFISASESFSRKNINCSIAESIERINPVIKAAAKNSIPARGYISCITHCPYDGPTAPEQVAELSRVLLNMGCYEVSLGDTIGAATPDTIRSMLQSVLNIAPAEKLAGHYHDTGSRALENIEASTELGIRIFDASAGGLGGCPHAPGSKGNVDSSRVNSLLARLGFDTGVDAALLSETAIFARTLKKPSG